MALARFRNLPPAQRAQIIETAARFFAQHGYAEASYSELLRELGMGKSQAYYYFADKADLFITATAACYEHYYEQAAQVPLPRTAADFWEYVHALTLLGFRFQNSDPVASRLTRAAVKSEVRFRLADALSSSEGSSREQHGRWVALGQELGAVRRDLDPAFLVRLSLEFALFVDGYFADLPSPVVDAECVRLADTFTDLNQRMFEPRPTPRSRGASQ
ncbi:MAG TPA: TetR/AcrR family transcriptional regulator [Polyangiaceae bacterium]|nr:TetR/AcrR family transcriptional regulator [Polyangiaceae bacterium]